MQDNMLSIAEKAADANSLVIIILGPGNNTHFIQSATAWTNDDHWSDMATLGSKELTHLPLVPHICVNEMGQHWFK